MMSRSTIALFCYQVNSRQTNLALFLYTLETLENRKVFWCFQGVEKGCTENKWVKDENHHHVKYSVLHNISKLKWVEAR